MTVSQAIQKPTASVVILAEVIAGLWCRAWVIDGTLTNSYKISVSNDVVAVRWNGDDSTLTERSSAANVNSNAASWYWDRSTQLLWIRPPGGQSIFSSVVQAMVQFWFSHPVPKIFDGRYYEPRLLGAPSISTRIEAVFGEVGQVGGGTMAFADVDGFFNSLMGYQWNAGSVVLKVGVDLPSGAMAFGDYETLATWSIEDWTRDDEKFEPTLVEPKARNKTKLPIDRFTLEDYPAIAQENVGKAIPIRYGKHYGVAPILLDGATKTFKVAGHAIRQFTRVAISRSVEEPRSITTAADEWELHSSDTYKYYLPGWAVKNVTSDGDSLAEKTSVDDVIATNGSWYSEGDYVYVNPQNTETIESETYAIRCVKTSEVFQEISFASTDEANAEFTLGDDFTDGAQLAVDFEGKTDADGNMMANPVDIIEDLLATVGETNLNAASFTEAAARLNIGTDQYGGTVTVRKPSVNLEEPTEVYDVIGEILAVIGGYLYSDANGQFTIGIMLPEPGEDLPLIQDVDLLEFEEEQRGSGIITKLVTRYAENDQENEAQVHEETRTDLQRVSNQPEPSVEDSTVTLYEEADVRYQAQRKLILEGQPIRKYQISVPWNSLTRRPGEQVHLQTTQRGVDEILEIIEVRIDIGSKRVRLTLGNLRGFEDSPGFWVADADVLPSRFATLAGYGSGSLVWNSSWDPEIKKWARQNVGYWTDENGFADPTDPESFIPSAWF